AARPDDGRRGPSRPGCRCAWGRAGSAPSDVIPRTAARSIAPVTAGTDGLQHLLRMLLRARHLLPVSLHLSVGTDPHGRANDPDGLLAVHHLLAVGAVRLHRLAVGIRRQREGQPVLLDELLMRGRGVGGNADPDPASLLSLTPPFGSSLHPARNPHAPFVHPAVAAFG